MTVLEQIQNADNTLKKLHADIEDLQKKKDGIEKELAVRREAEQLKSEELHRIRMAQLEHEYEKKKAEIDLREKYLDDYMVRLDNQGQELATRKVDTEKLSTEVTAKMKETEDRIAGVTQQFNDEKRAIEKQRGINEAVEKANAEKAATFAEQERSNQAYLKNLDDQRQALARQTEELRSLLQKNNEVLNQIATQRDILKVESIAIKENLDAIEAKRQELLNLSAVKDDLVKLETMRQDLEAKEKMLKEESHKLEILSKTVAEKETAASEKEKYQMIREREINTKIEILRKIRAGESA